MITRQPLATTLSSVFLAVTKVALLLGVVLCLAQPAWADLTDYALFGNSSVGVGNNGDIGGSVGSNGPIAFGSNAVVTGDVNAGGNVAFMANGTVGGVVNALQGFAGVLPFSGNVASPASYLPLEWPPNFGSLPPGQYGQLVLGDYEALTLTSGDYYFNDFIVGSNLTLRLDLTAPGALRIYVKNSASFGDSLNTSLVVDGSADRVFAQTDAGWFIGNDSNWFGTIYAPRSAPDVYDSEGNLIHRGDTTVGLVTAGDYFSLTGALYGDTIAVGHYADITGRPFAVAAPVIPAPGAIVLGALGLGLVGYLKRRF